jgi:hypothetical protein
MAPPRSPFDDPVPRGNNVFLATLRIAVTLGCWGAAAARLAAGDQFGLLDPLVDSAGFSTAAANGLLDKLAWGLVLCGLLTLVRPCWPVLLPVTVWFALLAAIGPALHQRPIQPVTHALRYLGPLALLVIDLWPPRIKFSLGRAMVGHFFLRMGIVLTFAGEGLVALLQSRLGGPLVTQLANGLSSVFRADLTTEQVQTTLAVIGGVYVGLALGLLLVRSRAIALLMTLVGCLGAMSYVVGQGPHAWPQALLHMPVAMAPLALFLHWWLAVKEQPAITVPA